MTIGSAECHCSQDYRHFMVARGYWRSGGRDTHGNSPALTHHEGDTPCGVGWKGAGGGERCDEANGREVLCPAMQKLVRKDSGKFEGAEKHAVP